MLSIPKQGWLKRQTKNFQRSMNVMLAGALMLGSTAGLLPQAAFAANAGDVQITAAMPYPSSGGTEYITVKNMSAGGINLNGWIVDDGSAHTITGTSLASGAEATICANPAAEAICTSGFESALGLNNTGGDTITLFEGAAQIDQVSYTEAQTVQGSEITFAASPAVTSALAAEEFVTHDGSYKGISVGFNAKDFGTVTKVTVDMTRDDGTHAVKHGTQDLFDLIETNAAPYKFTAPFVIQAGSYDPASDSYWTSDPTSWTTATVPTSVEITVEGSNGNKEVTNTNFLQNDASHPSYESLLPPAPVPTDPYKNGFETNTDDWTGGVTQVTSGTNGVTSSDGSHHATSGTDYTGWGHPHANVWPTGGYTTEIDVYLDTDEADGAATKKIQWNSAVNNTSGDLLEEAFFELQTDPATAGQINVRESIVGPEGFKKQDWAAITESGWYTLRHHFSKGTGGLLDITLQMLDDEGNTVTSHTYGGYDNYVIGDNVGGSRYGWFSKQSFTSLAIDNACLYLGAPQTDGCDFTDTQGPAAPEILTPNPEQYFNSTPILNDWTDVSDPSGINHYQVEYVYDDGHSFSNMPYRETTVSQRNHKPNVGEQGGVTIRVRAFDGAGNAGAWSEPVHYFYDSVAPAAPTLLSPANGTPINGEAPIANDWEDVAGADHYTYQSFNVKTDGSCDFSTVRWEENYTASQTNSRTLADGLQYCWRVKAIDAAGNKSGWSDVWKTVVDNTAPAKVSGIHIEQNSVNLVCNGYITDRHITIDWDDSTDPNFDHFNYQNKDGGTIKKPTESEFTGYIRDQDGYYKYRVQAVDKAGNKGEFSEWCGVTLDREAPAVTFLAPANGSTVNELKIGVKATDLSLKNLKFEVRNLDTGYLFNVKKITDTDGNGVIQLNDYDLCANDRRRECTSADITDGHYQIRAFAYDSAGHRNITEKLFLTIDKTAPSVTVNAPSDDTDTTPTITGTTSDQADTVVVTVDGIDYPATVAADGSWSAEVTNALVQGTTYTADATSTDAVGNVGSANVDFTVEAPDSIQFGGFGGSLPQVSIVSEGPLFLGDAVQNVFAALAGDSNDNAEQNGENKNKDAISLSTDDNNSDKAEVAGASSNKISNWWWLLVVAAVVVVIVFFVYRRSRTDEASS